MFAELAKNTQNYKDSLVEIITQSMSDNSAEIIDMNLEQLSQGKLTSGSLITPELKYEDYAKEKKDKGGKAPKWTPDLKNEGDFYDGWYTKPVKDGLEIGSNDAKSDKLERDYSNKRSKKAGQIFGLKDEDAEIIAKYGIKKLQDEFTKITNI